MELEKRYLQKCHLNNSIIAFSIFPFIIMKNSTSITITSRIISIKKLNKLCVLQELVHPENRNSRDALTLNAEMMHLGYIMSERLMNAVCTLGKDSLAKLYNEVIPTLQNIKGADVQYKSFYPNFPKQVMDTSNFELYLNAITHYWSNGVWKPDYEKIPRELAFESSKFIEIDLATKKEVYGIFTTLLSSNSSLSAEDNSFVIWFLDNCAGLPYPKTIPFKETMCLVAGKLIDTAGLTNCIKTATDVLRVFTHLSGGDVSLAANTKFKSLPKRQRRRLVTVLESVINEDDISRHKKKWIKAFHSLHIGDYSKQCPKSFAIAKKLRNKERLNSFASKVEEAFAHKDIETLLKLLESRPGDFARRLDHALRIGNELTVVHAFNNIADKISTRVLVQLLGHLKARNKNESRIVFPKGSISKAVILRDALPKVGEESVATLSLAIQTTLEQRFSNLNALGKTWIDPALSECPVPMQQRNASTGIFSVARGTRLPMSNKDTLRFFIYWVGKDIDLSATIHDADLSMTGHISYTNLKSNKYKACHSGDIVRAPNGAAEFIDINIVQAVERGARYIVMHVLVFSGPNFSEHKKCYAGWMTKNHPNKGDIFDPKLVEQKIDVTCEAMGTIPIVFDLVERKGIWCDLTVRNLNGFNSNNIENNKASTQETLKSIINIGNKPTLHHLFTMHGKSRGKIVDNQEEADTIFSLNKGITPYNVNEISSEFLA